MHHAGGPWWVVYERKPQINGVLLNSDNPILTFINKQFPKSNKNANGWQIISENHLAVVIY